MLITCELTVKLVNDVHQRMHHAWPGYTVAASYVLQCSLLLWLAATQVQRVHVPPLIWRSLFLFCTPQGRREEDRRAVPQPCTESRHSWRLGRQHKSTITCYSCYVRRVHVYSRRRLEYILFHYSVLICTFDRFEFCFFFFLLNDNIIDKS